MNTLKSIIQALPSAASSLYGLIAYGITIVSWLIVANKVNRNKALLKNIIHIPETDRLKALEMEMGAVRLKEGLSAAEWLKFKTKQYLMTGYIVTLVTVLLIIIVALFRKPSKPGIDLTLEPSSIKLDSSYYADSNDDGNPKKENFDTGISKISIKKSDFRKDDNQEDDSYPAFKQISYEYSKENNSIKIFPKFDYLERSEKGEIMQGLNYEWEPFPWEIPKLSYRVVNNTTNTLLISEVVINVKKSEINTSPILLVTGNNYNGNFYIVNEGWGKVLNASLKLIFSVDIENNNLQNKSFITSKPVYISLGNFSRDTSIQILPYLSKEIKANVLDCNTRINEVCVGGMCTFSSDLDNLKCLDESPAETCSNVSGKLSDKFIQSLLKDANEFKDGKKYDIKDIYFVRDCRHIPINVFGELSYFDVMDKKNKTFRFQNLVSLGKSPVGAPAPPSYKYDLFLKAGKSDYTIRIPTSQEVKTGSVDQFIINVFTNKSSNYDLSMMVYDATGNILSQNDVDLRIIIPRSSVSYAYRGEVSKTKK